MSSRPDILIVENDPNIQQTLRLILKEKSYRLTLVGTGQEALALAQEQFFNIALINIGLSDMRGTALIAQLKKHHPPLEVLLITGYADLENAIQAVSNGAAHYFIKPLNMDEVQAKIKEVLEKQSLVLENKRLYEATLQELGERKRAERALRQSETKYRTLFESASEAIILLKVAGDQTVSIVDCNQSGLELFGGTREQIIGQTPLDLSPPAQPDGRASEKAVQQYVQAVLEGPPFVFEWQYCRLDGSTVDCEVGLTRIDLGDECFIQAIIRDITHRKQAEAEIRRRNRELTLLNRIIAASATTTDAESILEITCKELARAFDVPQALAFLPNKEKTAKVVVAEYLENASISTLGHAIPAAGNAVADALLAEKSILVIEDARNDARLAQSQQALKQLGTASMLIVPLTIGGEVAGTLNLGTIVPHTFSAEEINLIQSVADQVSGVLDRAQLDKERRQLSAVIEQSAESVIITDTEGIILYVNPAFERVTGYTREEAIGNNPNMLSSGEHLPEFFKELWDTLKAGRVWHGRLKNKKKDGSIYTEETIIGPVRDEAGNIVNYVSLQRDITRELQLEEQYRRSQRMEAVGQLTGGIAHDFNNLLTAINGFAELLKFRLPPDDSKQELVGNILNAGQRAADLVSQLLAYSRKQIIEPRVLNLNTVVTSMGTILQRVIGEDIELKLLLGSDIWPVKIDPTQFEQVILNMAINARDAMPQGGKLTIETHNVVLDEDYVARHLGAQPGEHVLLAISDTGAGMSKEIQVRIFEPFFTTKEVGQGSGLGLATVFGIVKQSQGNIWVYSEPEQGSTFRIYLPHAKESVQLPVAAAPQEIELPRGSETILLVEDDANVRDLAKQILQAQGYTLLEAAHPTEALQHVDSYSGTIHLLLTDVVMPGFSGKQLAEQLHAELPHLKVLYMSGYTENVVAHHGVLESGVVFLQKPFNATTLTRQVRAVLDGKA